MTDEKTIKKILIVEDEIAIQNILCDKLAQEGYDVHIASDGDEGLTLALAEHPDLILLDILMPKVSGLKMLESLRADIWGKHVHVFVLTNLQQSKEKSAAFNQHVAKYFDKADIKLEDLLLAVKTYI